VSKLQLQLPLCLALLLAACGSSTSASSTTSSSPATSSTSAATGSSSVKLATRSLPGVGVVLVNGQGRTLYTFAPDKGKSVTCTGACAAIWPPLAIASGQKASAGGGVKASLLSSDANPAGGQVVTYDGWPLYLYVADPHAGTDHGQGINSSGGLWYVISPSGQVVKGRTSPATSSSSSSGGGSVY
jgi:predicted lipoprotein with Yx(FWY)xxD motif